MKLVKNTQYLEKFVLVAGVLVSQLSKVLQPDFSNSMPCVEICLQRDLQNCGKQDL